ncbi:MAG: hypothetical protein M3397_03575 [Actinomycetota bacterium]|nr:hypothetical protein [Actinomycetota bacterium]MDQ3567148.1 hypothetical protein [Actinomycetota bacterium]
MKAASLLLAARVNLERILDHVLAWTVLDFGAVAGAIFCSRATDIETMPCGARAGRRSC